MNKRMFFSGLFMVGSELALIMLYLFSTIDWSWLTSDLIIKAIALSVFALLNIAGFIFMIVGAIRKE